MDGVEKPQVKGKACRGPAAKYHPQQGALVTHLAQTPLPRRQPSISGPSRLREQLRLNSEHQSTNLYQSVKLVHTLASQESGIRWKEDCLGSERLTSLADDV